MIRVNVQPTVLTLDVQGAATMISCAAVHDTVGEHLSCGIRLVRVDLRDCTAMDSTFSGTLLALHRELERVGGKLVLVSPSARILEILRLMGLEDFYPIDVSERATGAWRDVTPAHPKRDALRQLVLDAHDALAQVPGPAASTFREVVDELRRCEEAESSTGRHP